MLWIISHTFFFGKEITQTIFVVFSLWSPSNLLLAYNLQDFTPSSKKASESGKGFAKLFVVKPIPVPI